MIRIIFCGLFFVMILCPLLTYAEVCPVGKWCKQNPIIEYIPAQVDVWGPVIPTFFLLELMVLFCIMMVQDGLQWCREH